MAVLKVIEVMASSSKSWEDATLTAVKRTAKTVKNIRSVWVKDQSMTLTKSGKPKEFRTTVKISFEVGSTSKA